MKFNKDLDPTPSWGEPAGHGAFKSHLFNLVTQISDFGHYVQDQGFLTLYRGKKVFLPLHGFGTWVLKKNDSW